MTQTEQPDQSDTPSDYKEYADQLTAIKIENERLLARNTLVISGGAFTLSIALLKDLYTSPIPWTKWVLIGSWVLFGLCAFLQFYADYLSGLAVDVQRQNFDQHYPDLERFGQCSNKYNGWVGMINAMTPWIICLGFLCMITFSAANFVYSKGATMSKQSQTTETKKPNPQPVEKGVTMPSSSSKPSKPVRDKPKPKS
ncbi:MAG TPA: hypothetical protein DHV36_22220 [Desulfobacteraceae bacterium]|nr:hypothetical protein [Desulfobacteraceae bacterium]